MKRGILFAAIVALIGSASVSCRRATDPREVATVDSLINAMHAARLTLNELDTQRYALADSILGMNRARFLERFNDTLDKNAAITLGDQFVQLREANRRGLDHRQVAEAVDQSSTRLTRLRHDLTNGALEQETVQQALMSEGAAAKAIEKAVLQVIDGHRENSRALDRQVEVDSLLAISFKSQEKR